MQSYKKLFTYTNFRCKFCIKIDILLFFAIFLIHSCRIYIVYHIYINFHAIVNQLPFWQRFYVGIVFEIILVTLISYPCILHGPERTFYTERMVLVPFDSILKDPTSCLRRLSIGIRPISSSLQIIVIQHQQRGTLPMSKLATNQVARFKMIVLSMTYTPIIDFLLQISTYCGLMFSAHTMYAKDSLFYIKHKYIDL